MGRNQELIPKENDMGLIGVLTVIFVLAKLGGYIDWSWWIVFIPVYGAIALFVIITALVALLRR